MTRIFRPVCLISACLCGVPCRYDGQGARVERLAELCDSGFGLAVCPEMEGGLPAPRPPCELRGGRVLTREGGDVTHAFTAGAEKLVRLAKEHGIRLAILKENSPSCGSSMIYDGRFSGTRVPGQGVTTALLREHGIAVVNEWNFEEALNCSLSKNG